MRKYIIIASLCILSQLSYAKADHYGRIKMGAYAGTTLGINHNDRKYSNQEFSANANNGLLLGGYFRFEKRAMVLESNLSYDATLTNIQFEHPQLNELKYKNSYLQHSISHRYQMGFKINRSNPQHIELGLGMYFTHDINRENQFLTKSILHTDQTTGLQQNVLAYSYSQSYPIDELRKGALLYMQFHNNNARTPWSIKLSYQTGPRNRSKKDIVSYYDINENRRLIYQGHKQLAPNQLHLIFVLQLFNFQKNGHL